MRLGTAMSTWYRGTGGFVWHPSAMGRRRRYKFFAKQTAPNLPSYSIATAWRYLKLVNCDERGKISKYIGFIRRLTFV